MKISYSYAIATRRDFYLLILAVSRRLGNPVFAIFLSLYQLVGISVIEFRLIIQV